MSYPNKLETFIKISGRILTLIGLLTFQPVAFAQTSEYKSAYSAYQTQDFEQAYRTWEGLAKNGDINAQYALGVMELRNETTDASPQRAFKWFEMAASQGHSTAMFNVAVAYWEGSGVPKNRDQALQWWEKSAISGDSGAQFNLGLAYYIGEEKISDLEKAAKWIKMAANQNHPEAKRIYEILIQDSPELKLVSTDITASDTAESDETTQSSPETIPETVIDQSESVIDSNIVTKDTVQFWKTSNDVALRAEASLSAAVFGTLPSNTPVVVINNNNGWSQITLPAGLKMWVYETFIDAHDGNGVIKGTGVRVRPQPSTDNNASPPVGAYRNGDRVVILEKRKKWYRIRAPKHIGGWVQSSRLISYQDTEENRSQLWDLMVAKGL